MPTRVGTHDSVDASTGDGSTTVTVDAAANVAVAFWAQWDGNLGSTLATLTLNGVGFTFESQLSETGDKLGVGVARLVNPALSTQTLAWTWSAGGARTNGGRIYVVYVQDGNTGDPVRAAGTDSQLNATNVAVALSTQATDLLLAFCCGDTAPVLDGTVYLDNNQTQGLFHDLSEVTPSAGTTTVNMTGEDFSAMAAISLKAIGGGGGTPPMFRGS